MTHKFLPRVCKGKHTPTKRVKTSTDALRGLGPMYLLFLSTEYYSNIIQKIGMQVYSYGYQ